MTTDVLLLLAGLAVLVFGAEVLVRSGTNLAARLGISPLTIGLTVVAIGTSMPELAVGIDAAARGNPGLAVGNIVGTNLVNILLILGLSALIAPIPIARRTLYFDLPLMTVSALAVYFLGRGEMLSTRDAWLLLLIGVLYTVGVVILGRREQNGSAKSTLATESESSSTPTRSAFKDVSLLLGSLIVIVIGADLLVGQRDIAIGNLIGSSVYNIAFVLAITTIVVPGDMPVPAAIRIDLAIVALVSLACIPVFLTHKTVTRIEGALFVLAYCAYLGWLIATRT